MSTVRWTCAWVSAATVASVLSLLFVYPAAQSPSAQTIRRHFTPADRDSGRYQYVPFDVPQGTKQIAIGYRYDSRDGASVVDLGLFEPGPLDLGTRSFRGYSGGAQRQIMVGTTWASPGYRAGILPHGRWHVLLGLYKVAPEGVDVDVDIRVGPAEAARPPSRVDETFAGRGSEATTAPPVERGRWFSGALHLHTIHSDGALSPVALSTAAREAGIDFIAITDHNNTFHAGDPNRPGPLRIIGEEITTPGGHANVWGLEANSWIDFRVRPSDRDAARAIDRFVEAAHRVGALFSINHPFDVCGGCSWEHHVPPNLDAIEVWNGGAGPQEQAVEMWDRLLRGGTRATAVGASDWHRPPGRIDAPIVRVLAEELNQAKLLAAIRRGAVVVMRDAATPMPLITARCGGRPAEVGDTLRCAPGTPIAIRVTGSGVGGERADVIVNGVRSGSQAIGAAPATMSVPAAAGYIRVEVRSPSDDVIALTNPIHVSVR